MTRRILVVHDFGVMRRIIRTYAMAELGDMSIEVAESSAEGLDKLRQEHYDVVIAGMQMKDMNGIALRRAMQSLPHNEHSAFLVVTSNDSGEQRALFREQGIDDWLLSPFSPDELRQAVERLLDATARRSFPRFAIPDTTASIRLGDTVTEGRVVNASRGGFFFETEIEDQDLPLLREARITLRFSPDFGSVECAGIGARLVRLTCRVKEEGERRAQRASMAWQFTDIPPAAAANLKQVLERAESELRRVEAEVHQGTG